MRAARYLGPGARHLVLVAVTFDNLQNYTALVRKTTIDASLYRLDLALFGVEPTVWMRRFYHPLLTDWMASCYAIFLVTPMFLAIALSLRGRREDFREIVQAVMLQMWSAFFIFICLRRDHRAISSRCARACCPRKILLVSCMSMRAGIRKMRRSGVTAPELDNTQSFL